MVAAIDLYPVHPNVPGTSRINECWAGRSLRGIHNHVEHPIVMILIPIYMMNIPYARKRALRRRDDDDALEARDRPDRDTNC